jgi:hypothetical protein
VKRLRLVGLCVAAALLGAVGYRAFQQPKTPPEATVIERVREVARLETLEVTLYKKISFAPDPREAKSTVAGVLEWARFTLRPPKGKAILFAKAHVGFDLDQLDAKRLRVDGDRVLLALPPLKTQIELMPGETEVIDSNLDSQQTAQLFDTAKQAFEHEVQHDRALQEKAKASAQRALTGLLLGLGFREVQFVDALPASSRT